MTPVDDNTAWRDRAIWTVGHSNHTVEGFISLLQRAGVGALADVRRFPGSRRLPHFGGTELEASLAAHGIVYQHFESLGGRRGRSQPGSPNTAWRVESFNAYADHMASPEFQASVEELDRQAQRRRTAVMCAEAVPWRCHRRILADALIARGWQVYDIFSNGRVRGHAITEFARVENGRVTYPGGRLFE